MRRRSAVAPVLALALGLGLASGCGPSAADVADQAVQAARAALVRGEDSAALAGARKALSEGADTPALRLVAARACLSLKRWSEAIEQARAGLGPGPRTAPDPELAADLSWALGKAALGRFRDLGSQDDWRLANSSLEAGSAAGSQHAESAYALVLLQQLSPKGSSTRARRFNDLLQQLAPGSPEAAKAALLVARDGSDP